MVTAGYRNLFMISVTAVYSTTATVIGVEVVHSPYCYSYKVIF